MILLLHHLPYPLSHLRSHVSHLVNKQHPVHTLKNVNIHRSPLFRFDKCSRIVLLQMRLPAMDGKAQACGVVVVCVVEDYFVVADVEVI